MQNIALLIVSCTLFAGTGLFADSVTYTVTSNAGQFNNSLTLTNSGTTGGTVFDLFVSIPTDIRNIDTSNIGTPIGWGDPTGGLLFFGADERPSTSFIEWAADASGLYDVQIDSSLKGFSFIMSQSAGDPITFALNGSTTFSTALQGVAVPEPNSLSTVLLVVILLFAFSVMCKTFIKTPEGTVGEVNSANPMRTLERLWPWGPWLKVKNCQACK